MKPLIFRINAKDDGVDAALNKVVTSAKKTGKQLKDAFGDGASAAELLKTTLPEIKPPPALVKTEQSLKRVRTEADKTGKDIKQAFVEASRGVSPLSQEFEAMRGKLSQLRDQAEEMKGSLKGGLADSGFARLFEFDAMAGAADRLAGNAERLYSGFARAGESGRDLERTIKRIFDRPEDAERFVKVAKDLKHEYQGLFSADQIAEAIGALKRFGVATEANAKRVAAMAAVNPGVSPEQVAETYGEFRKAAIGGKHDFGSTESLRSQLGIDPAELVKFGAEIDKNNKLLGDTAAQATKAQRALDAYIDSQARYQGVAERAADGQSKLSAEMDKFQGSIGKVINEWKNLAGEALTPAVKKLNESSSATKSVAAAAVTGAAGLGSFGAKALELAAYAKLAGVAISGTGILIAGLGVAIAGATGYTVAQVAAFRDYEKTAKQAMKAQQDFRDTLNRANADPRRQDMRGKSVDDIIDEVTAEKNAGAARAKITDAILAKQDELEDARQQHDKAAEERAKKEVGRLLNWRAHMDSNTAAETAALAEVDAAREANYHKSVERYNEMQKLASRGAYGTKQEELAALNALIPTLDPNSDVRGEAEGKRRQLETAAAKERIADVKADIAERKALNQASLQDELKAIQDQLAIAKRMGKAGQQERIQLYAEEAVKKAEIQKASDKKILDSTRQALADAAKISSDTKTYDRGTGQAVGAYDKAIERVKAWQAENAKLITKFPELGQRGQAAIEQLSLQRAAADVSRMGKNFADLQREIKLAGDQAVTTAEKISAADKALGKIKSAESGGRITAEQATQAREPLQSQKDNLERTKRQEDIAHQQQMTSIREQAAQTELAILQSIADGSLASNDKILAATEKLHQIKMEALEQERDAAIAAGQDRAQAEERYQAQVDNLERKRTAEFLAGIKQRSDARKAELQQTIDANKTANGGKTGLSFGMTDNASFMTIGGSDEDYRKRKEAKRAEAELAKIEASERFRIANPEAVARVAEEERKKRLKAADPSGLVQQTQAGMQSAHDGAASGPQTVNNNQQLSVVVNVDGKGGKTETASSPEDAVSKVRKAIADSGFFNGESGGLG